MYKQNFEEILESVQAQILQHFGVGEEELEAATELFREDGEVSALVAQLEGLYLGALRLCEPRERDGREREVGGRLLLLLCPRFSRARVCVCICVLFITHLPTAMPCHKMK